MESLNVVPERLDNGDNGGCVFDGMPMLLLLSHTVLPLLTVPMTFMLIPDSNMRAELPREQEPSIDESGNREEQHALVKSNNLATEEDKDTISDTEDSAAAESQGLLH